MRPERKRRRTPALLAAAAAAAAAAAGLPGLSMALPISSLSAFTPSPLPDRRHTGPPRGGGGSLSAGRRTAAASPTAPDPRPEADPPSRPPSSSSSLPSPGTQAATWAARLEALRSYAATHGGTAADLPSLHPPDPALATWVANQRHQYRHLLAGRYSSLTAERVRELREAGLDLGPFRDRAWEARFAQLVRFRERHGHCRVPELGGEGGEEGEDAAGLGRWVARQRFLAHADGRDDGDAESSAPLLPVDRWRRLDEIGFEWEQRGRRWTAMLERLEAVLAGGAADPDPSGGGGPDPPPPHSPDPVPTDVALAAATRRLRAKRLLLNPSNRDLRVWVRAQRDQHARRMRGLPSSLTDERIARLESIPGWRWVGRRGPVTGYDDDDPEGGGRGRAKPSASDWSRLLEEARKVDVAAKVIPNPSAADIMDWDDDNLADLWDMEDD